MACWDMDKWLHHSHVQDDPKKVFACMASNRLGTVTGIPTDHAMLPVFQTVEQCKDDVLRRWKSQIFPPDHLLLEIDVAIARESDLILHYDCRKLGRWTLVEVGTNIRGNKTVTLPVGCFTVLPNP